MKECAQGHGALHVRPAQALVIKPHWCEKIFKHGKIWEVRTRRCLKRGRFSIAASGSKKLLGEATIVDCFPIAKRAEDGSWGPYSCKASDRENFIGAPENLQKHQIKNLELLTGSVAFAWVLTDVKEYPVAVTYEPTAGPLWAPLEGRVQWPEVEV